MQPGISKSVVQALLTAEFIPLLAKVSQLLQPFSGDGELNSPQATLA